MECPECDKLMKVSKNTDDVVLYRCAYCGTAVLIVRGKHEKDNSSAIIS
jgi:DNA-directed RNA polymerase subunit M/transcription elongation factor TFIIS